jgi:nitric oxide reductase activation protein
MNREQLKTLINEAIKEVLNEKTPPGFDPELKKQILKQYPGEPDKAYATMQKIHKDTAGKKKKKSVKEQEGDSTDGGEEKTQEIKLTLDRETAQKLHDLLMAQLATSNDTEGGNVQPVAQDTDDDQLPDGEEQVG